jgi:small-conductance mechanosensitive channel
MDTVSQLLNDIDWERPLFSSGRIVLILILAFVAMIIIRAVLTQVEKRLQARAERAGEDFAEAARRSNTLMGLVRQAAFIALWVVVILIVLKEIGVEIAPILASAGIVGLAVGFGAQNLVRDVISGFFIILENQIRVGDVAVVNGTSGMVERINFRTTVLRDLAGTVHIFPNGAITTLSNMTRDWSGYVLNVSVAYKEDIDRVVEIMKQVGQEIRADENFKHLMIADVEIFGVDKLADSGVVIQGRLKTRPIKQWEVGREYLRRLKRAFDREGIEIPFPQRTFYFGDTSPPFLAKLTEQSRSEQVTEQSRAQAER